MKSCKKIHFASVLLGMAVGGHAWAVCVANDMASGTATQISPTVWTYVLNVENGCASGNMTDFYIPYFADAGIANITVPATAYYYNNGVITNTITWSATVEANNNLFNLSGAGVVDFQVTVSPETQVNGNSEAGVGYYSATFGFTADYGSVEAPAAVLDEKYTNQGVSTGSTLNFIDPPIPGSPDTIAALNGTATPEPGTSALMIIGLGTAGGFMLRRRSKHLDSSAL